MDLFYLPLFDTTTASIVFPKDESKHIAKVLRKQAGDQLQLTNGKGLEAIVRLDQIGLGKVTATLLKKIQHPQPKVHLHLAIAPTKNIGRMEWFLEKATEIGIQEITPLLCDHSERKVIKPERLDKIIIAALKQSKQFHKPQLNPMLSFKEFVSLHNDGFIAHCHEGEKPSFFELLEGKNNITVLIGPEGDFSPAEVATAVAQNFQPISLGTQRLRTETAAIVATHTVALKTQ
ncbi:MAG: 16S rRNA (uracil(1498)-N(3))-methyltransferase [Flavobacteriaceae bacterium]